MRQELIKKRDLDAGIKDGSIMLGFQMKYNPNILPKGAMEPEDKETQKILMNALMDQELWIYYDFIADPADALLEGKAFENLKKIKFITKLKKAKDGCFDKL